MAGILKVRNIEQAALWLELDGQISDGFWENARPYDHWQVWCDAEVQVAAHPFELGRNFYARRTTYNFTAKALLDVVGKRMLGIVRIARRFGIEVASQLAHDVRCEDGMIAFPSEQPTSDWEIRQATKFARLETMYGASRQALEFALVDPTYTFAMMRADLADLKHIVKQWSASQAPEVAVDTLREALEADLNAW